MIRSMQTHNNLRRLSLLTRRARSFDQARNRRRRVEADQNEIRHEHA